MVSSMAVKGQDREGVPSLDISNVVAAFSEEQVERMVGLTKGRLRYWARTGFFRPSFVEEESRLPYSRFYSFKDIVALRTLEMLRVRNGVPLQQLRKVASHLSQLGDDLWTKAKLFVSDRKVAFVSPETGRPQEIVSGQYLLEIHLSKVIRDTEDIVAQFRLRPQGSVGHLSKRRGVLRNALVVAGTRIPVAAIVRLAEDGFSMDRILTEYPDVRAEDVEAALKHEGKAAA